LTGTDQHAIVGKTVLFLVTAGPVFILMCGLASWFLARDISKDTESVIVGMETLAAENLGESTPLLPVLSPDELGDLIEAFNHLAKRLANHDRLLRKGAADASEADRRQMEFLAVVSHDLRTPLHSITGFGELLLESSDQELSVDQREDVVCIQNASNHLLRLVDDIVDFSKIETGLMELTLQEVDIGEVVRQALAAGSGLRAHKEVKLASQVPHDLPAVRADETRLRQVLFNLVGNALKFTQQGEIRVIVGPEENGMIEVAVSDSGPGIPPSKLDRVFEEFEQVRTSDISTAKGTGLGLAISKKLIQMHGGDIRASNRPQGGAVFSFTVPVVTRQESSL
ncbi:MAG: HAMP domain-containing histidine kinase, partial [Deltaproteobacteria bacterium]|nr:HAMP domain-containing histidine kinase [Deltaproteobacteria bacterium]